MKRYSLVILLIALAFSVAVGLAAKPANVQLIDKGAFGVSVNGKRVATESFSVEQREDGSVTRSEIRLGGDEGTPAQSFEMELDPNGNLRRYQWQHLDTDKASLLVEPNESFLVEHLSEATGKSRDIQHLLPNTTIILDDYFFSQRELLAWRFMASGCKPDPQGLRCELGKHEYATLNPNQHLASNVTIEFAGQQKIPWKGSEQPMLAFKLSSETGDWTLWLDQSQKLVKISVDEANTEVERE